LNSDNEEELEYEVANPPGPNKLSPKVKGRFPKCPKRNVSGIFVCKFCDTKTRFPSKWKAHMATHFSKRFKCPDCDADFSTSGDRDRHNFDTHQCKEKYKCEKCDYENPIRKQFLHHLASHNKKLKCSECDYFSNDKSNMNRHFQKHHA
jgi:hypothetical protein